jgi:hypothetical protein
VWSKWEDDVKLFLMKYGVGVSTGFNWLRTGKVSKFAVTKKNLNHAYLENKLVLIQ